MSFAPAFGRTDGAEEKGSEQSEATSVDAEQRRLLQEIRKTIAALPPLPLPTPDEPTFVRERRERETALVRLVTEIERRLKARSQGEKADPPKEAVIQYRSYFDRVRVRIEEGAAQDPPMHGGAALNGHLTLVLLIGSDGRLKSADVQNPSSEEFKQYILRLAQRLAPFETFPHAMARWADDVEIHTQVKYDH